MEQIEAAGGVEALFELITIVRQDPRIWDRTSTNYITHFDAKIQRFTEIAEQLNLEGVSAEMVASAWRELSEKYRRRLYDGKRRNGATNWPYFEAMNFLRDQYEQTKWYRPSSVSRPNQISSPSNVAHLVDTFLTAQAVLDAEQTISKAVEPMLPTLSDSLQQKGDALLAGQIGNGDERKNEFATKYELVDAAFQSFTNSELAANVDVENNIAISSAAADSTKSPERFEEKQSISPAVSIDNLSQNSNNNITDRANLTHKARTRIQHLEACRSPRKMWKQQKQSALRTLRQQQNPGAANTVPGITTSEAVAEILRSARSGTSENPAIQWNTNPSSQQHCCQPASSETSSRWENVGRVWVDMMKTIRSPQLALAAHKYIMNTLFSVLEADQQLIGTDPNSTRVRIRENAPQIEITMHQ